MGKRVNTAQWMEKQQRWQIKVQKDNERKTFYSSKPGRTGQREANAKADAWLDENISNTNKRVEPIWNSFLASLLSKDEYKKADSVGNVLYSACNRQKANRLSNRRGFSKNSGQRS